MGDTSQAGNVISANDLDGILVDTDATNNLIFGNLIGLSLGGMAALSNSGHGVIINGSNTVVGGSNANQRNFIGANSGNGILVAGTGTGSRILGNSIGITTAGNSAGNTEHGIAIDSSGNTIGGTLPGDRNTIANNLLDGIAVPSNVQDNTFLGNQIYANQGLAIDLEDNGVSLNDNNLDLDTGANGLQNFPVINQAVLVGATTIHVEGRLGSTPNSSFRIEVFVNSSADSSGHGEAEEFLGAFTVTTDANGVAIFSESVSGVANPTVGDYVSATATVETTSGFGSTSELALSVAVTDSFRPITNGIPDVTVDEDAIAPTVDLSAHFFDIEDNSADLTYAIESQSNPSLLQSPTISNTGVLTLPLANNENGATNITISATDSSNNSVQTTFTLTVNPVNDPPVITSAGNYEINENVMTVGAVTSMDIDGNAPEYTITGGPDASSFTIDQMTGALSFNIAPDAEIPSDFGGNNEYELTVQVFDGTDTASIGITVTVKDVNEVPVSPLTDQDLALNVLSENAAPGTPVGIIAAASDTDISDSVSFTLHDNPGGLFEIDPTSGVVTLAANATLDRETDAVHTIGVTVTSSDNSFSEQNYGISVLDVNDNTPVINPGQIYSIAENASNTDTVATVVASDADVTNSNSTLQSWTIESGDQNGVFQIDANSGEISVANAALLDFETTPVYTLGVSVTDGTNQSVTEDVVINVLDINEPPTFTQVTNLTVAEGDSYTEVIVLTDPEGNPATIWNDPNLPGWLTFTANNDGTATLSGTPVNSDVGMHTITLTGSDNDPTSGDATLSFTITVTDVEHEPTINFQISHSVTEPTQIIGTVDGDDLDGDTLTYSLASTGDVSAFTIDQNTGVLSFQVPSDAEAPQDADNNNIYEITIQVSDGNSTTEQTLTIEVLDDNSEHSASAILDANPAPNEIAENALGGTLTGLDASSDDLDISDSVSFTLHDNPGGLFEIDPASGIVTLAANATLDRETDAVHTIGVTATSSDGSETAQTYFIVVTDINDNVPEIVNGQAFTIAESAAPGTLIGNIGATDVDTVGALQNWQIESGNENSIFILDSATGELSLDSNATLDFETTPQYTLGISVTDGINISITEDVVINISNVNEAPQFTSANLATATELSAFNFSVATADVDSGDSLSITASALPAWLILATTPGSNTATLSGTPGNADIGNHSIELTVTDAAGSSATQTLLVSVAAINQKPVITSPAPTTATEDLFFSQLITAGDADGDSLSFSADNLPAWLSLTDNGDGTATLQGTPGNADVGVNSFAINITDGDLSDTQIIDIDVVNVNDLPEIVFPAAISIEENTLLVGTVASNDVDGDAPVYSLASTGDYQSFSINPTTGELSFTSANDAENAADVNGDNVYEITVEVSDGVDVPVSKDVQITLTDVNEFGITNVIDSNANVNTLLENSTTGTLAGITASANDADISDSVTYSLLQSSNGLFAIEPSTGEVTLSPGATLDYEQTQNHTLVVQAASSDGTTSTQSFDIAVGDINDNAPVITAGQTLTIIENAPAGQVIDSVAASDVDNVGTLQNWAIVGGNDSGIFAINPLTGELSVNDPTALNFEQTQEYELLVQVSDGLQTATQTLNVAVLDINEPPVINNTQHTSVEGFTGEIGSIEAVDPDTGEITTFMIVGGTGQAAFEFGEGDQIVQTASIPPGVYTLDVIVTDASGTSTEATLEIRVFASDEMPELAGALPISFTSGINVTTPTTSNENQSETDFMVTQEVSDNMPELASETSATETEETDDTAETDETKETSIAESSTNLGPADSISDSRFQGSQARQEVRVNVTDRSEELRNLNTNNTVIRASAARLDILLQVSDNLVQGFNIDFDTVDFNSTLTPALLSAISDIKSDVDSAAKKNEIKLELAIKTGAIVSVTLTVGLITWLTQTGAFLTTALSTAPLWRSLDPIPVLISSYDDEEEDEDMERINA